MSAPTIDAIVAQIRTALYGKDVRENIALGIETCFDDLESNVEDIAIVAEELPSDPPQFNQIVLVPGDDEYVVFTSDDVASVEDTKGYLEIT